MSANSIQGYAIRVHLASKHANYNAIEQKNGKKKKCKCEKSTNRLHLSHDVSLRRVMFIDRYNRIHLFTNIVRTMHAISVTFIPSLYFGKVLFLFSDSV